MKRTLIIASLVAMIFWSGTATASYPNLPVDRINPESWLNMKAADFVKLTVKDFAKLTQKKLTLKDKFAFSVLKRNLKHEVKKNPNLIVNEYLAMGNKKISAGAWIAIILGVALITTIIIVGATTW